MYTSGPFHPAPPSPAQSLPTIPGPPRSLVPPPAAAAAAATFLARYARSNGPRASPAPELLPTPAAQGLTQADSSPTGAQGHVSTPAAAADSVPIRAPGRLPALAAATAATAAAPAAGGEWGARLAAESHG